MELNFDEDFDDELPIYPVDTNNGKKLILTLFSGYDSQLMAAEALRENHPHFDWECVGWSDIDKYACMMHDLVFPQYADKALGDVTQIDWNKVKESLDGRTVDLLTYSSPCFVAGTKILTNLGHKPIEDIAEGDMVLTHSKKYRKVIEPMVRQYKGVMFSIASVLGETVKCTPEHPFYIRSRNGELFANVTWKVAKELTKDDYLGFVAETISVPEDKQSEVFYEDGYVWCPISKIDTIDNVECNVYNMEVEEDHSYTANNVIVHNCQDISQAGKQMGLKEGSGSRSALLWNVSDAIEVLRPKYLLQENVAALVSNKFMPDFQLWLNRLESFGYVNVWARLNAKNYNVPQNRDRVFCLSMRKDVAFKYNFPKAVPLATKLEDVLEDEVDEKYFLKDDAVDKFLKANDKDDAVFVQFSLPPAHEDAMFLKTWLHRWMNASNGWQMSPTQLEDAIKTIREKALPQDWRNSLEMQNETFLQEYYTNLNRGKEDSQEYIIAADTETMKVKSVQKLNKKQ